MHPSATFGGRAVEPGSLVWMTDRSRPGAALVLAAGEGTRMRSAVPKVLHPIGGRSLLGHAVHAVAELDPEHLVVVLGHGGDQVAAKPSPRSATSWPARSPSPCRSSGWAPATRCAAGSTRCRAASPGPCSSRTATCRCCDADTLAALLAEHTASGRGGHAGHHRARRPHRLRPGGARDRRHRHPDRRAGRRHRRAAGDPRGQLRRVRVRRRVPRRRARAALDGEQPGRALPHRPRQDRARRRPPRCAA